MSMSTALMVRQISTAVAVHGGRRASDSNPACSAVRYRSASLVAASAAPSSDWANWNNRSAVVTIFSISELSLASSSGIVLISIVWFGINSAACFNAASAARASTTCLSTGRVSISTAGGSGGRSLYGRSGAPQADTTGPLLEFLESRIDDMTRGYVVAGDISTERVDKPQK